VAWPGVLLQECLYEDPWRVLVACVLLNKTSAAAVRGVVFQLFDLCPTAAVCVATPVEAIARLTNPLGLHRRAAHIKRMSEQYVAGGWSDVGELCGCGQYARDAFHFFCSGKWRDVQPRDKELVKYKQFLIDTDGLGHGLTRERVLPHEV
jgi:methyl-CpG-binding domain protein 4